MGARLELHNKLCNPEIAAPVVPVLWVWDVADTADVTYVAFVATRKCRIIRASYLQESNATAATSFVCTLKNGATSLTGDLDIKTLGADAGADFTIVDSDIADGDTIDVVFNETGGTVTAPDQVVIMIELQWLE
jgi:hypothetical protein